MRFYNLPLAVALLGGFFISGLRGPIAAYAGLGGPTSPGGAANAKALTISLPNDGVTGTVVNELASINSSGNAILTTAGATTALMGVCVSGCGTTGNAQIQIDGAASCIFNGAVTIGHYAQVDATNNGQCLDGGATYPTTGGEVAGTISTTLSGSQANIILFGADVANTGGGGGGGINAGVVGNPTYYKTANSLSGVTNIVHSDAFASVQAAWATCPNAAATPCDIFIDPNLGASPWTIGSSINITSAAYVPATHVVTLTMASTVPTWWGTSMINGMPIHVGGSAASGIPNITPTTLRADNRAVFVASASGTTVTYVDDLAADVTAWSGFSNACSANCGSASIPLMIGGSTAGPTMGLFSVDASIQCNGTSGGDCIEIGRQGYFFGNAKTTSSTENTGSIILPAGTAYITSLISSAVHGNTDFHSNTGGNDFVAGGLYLQCANIAASLTQGMMWMDGVSDWGYVTGMKLNGWCTGASDAKKEIALTTSNSSNADITFVDVDTDGNGGAVTQGYGWYFVTTNGAICATCSSNGIVSYGGMDADESAPIGVWYIDGTNASITQVIVRDRYIEVSHAGGTQALYVKNAADVSFDNVDISRTDSGNFTNCLRIDGTAGSTSVSWHGYVLGGSINATTCGQTRTANSGPVYNSIDSVNFGYDTNKIDYDYVGTAQYNPYMFDRSIAFNVAPSFVVPFKGSIQTGTLATPGGGTCSCQPSGATNIFWKVTALDNNNNGATLTKGDSATSAEFTCPTANENPLTGTDYCRFQWNSVAGATGYAISTAATTGNEKEEGLTVGVGPEFITTNGSGAGATPPSTSTSGNLVLNGATSGAAIVQVPAAAGSPALILPTVNTTGPTANPGTSGMALISTTAGVQSYQATEAHIGNAGAYGNNTNFPTGSIVIQEVAANAGHFTQLTSTNQSLNAGSCGTAPTFNVFDGASNTGTAKIASATAQSTRGTATQQTETQTFAAGDVIGIYISTAGGTCLAPTFGVDATVTYP